MMTDQEDEDDDGDDDDDDDYVYYNYYCLQITSSLPNEANPWVLRFRALNGKSS